MGAASRPGRLEPYRALGWAYVSSLGCLLLTTPGSHKTYYPLPAYPMLFAAGAVAIEPWLARPGRVG